MSEQDLSVPFQDKHKYKHMVRVLNMCIPNWTKWNRDVRGIRADVNTCWASGMPKPTAKHLRGLVKEDFLSP